MGPDLPILVEKHARYAVDHQQRVVAGMLAHDAQADPAVVGAALAVRAAQGVQAVTAHFVERHRQEPRADVDEAVIEIAFAMHRRQRVPRAAVMDDDDLGGAIEENVLAGDAVEHRHPLHALVSRDPKRGRRDRDEDERRRDRRTLLQQQIRAADEREKDGDRPHHRRHREERRGAGHVGPSAALARAPEQDETAGHHDQEERLAHHRVSEGDRRQMCGHDEAGDRGHGPRARRRAHGHGCQHRAGREEEHLRRDDPRRPQAEADEEREKERIARRAHSRRNVRARPRPRHAHGDRVGCDEAAPRREVPRQRFVERRV